MYHLICNYSEVSEKSFSCVKKDYHFVNYVIFSDAMVLKILIHSVDYIYLSNFYLKLFVISYWFPYSSCRVCVRTCVWEMWEIISISQVTVHLWGNNNVYIINIGSTYSLYTSTSKGIFFFTPNFELDISCIVIGSQTSRMKGS